MLNSTESSGRFLAAYISEEFNCYGSLSFFPNFQTVSAMNAMVVRAWTLSSVKADVT